MNLSELRAELERESGLVEDVGAHARLDEVRVHVRAARRRRAGTAVGMVAAAAVATGVIVLLAGGGSPRGDAPITHSSGPTSAPVPAPTPVVVAAEVPGFASTVGSMKLLDAVEGEPGATELALDVVAPLDRVRIAVWCFGERTPRVTSRTEVAGIGAASAQEAVGCHEGRPTVLTPSDIAYGPVGGGSAPPPYAQLGEDGGPVSVRTRMTDIPRRGRLAIAVYAVPHPITTLAGTDIYPRWFDGRRTWEPVGYAEHPAGSDAVRLDLSPTGGRPRCFYWFSLSGPSPGGELHLLVDGEVEDSVLEKSAPREFSSQTAGVTSSGGGRLGIRLAAQTAHRVEMRAEGADPDKLGLTLICYAQVPDAADRSAP